MLRGRIFAALALVALAGCGVPNAPLLSGQEARVALEKSLEAWKSGQPPASLAGLKPPIDAVDHEWTARKELSEFTIGTSTEGQGNKSFAVTLTLKGAPAKDVKYMVFGLDTIHIYRDDDFARMSNMEDGPATPKGRR